MYGTPEVIGIGVIALSLVYLIQWLIKRFTASIDKFSHSIDANTKLTKEVWILLKNFNGKHQKTIK